jgi:hypothetical protein
MSPRAQLVREWFNALQAPSKEMVVFRHSAHDPCNQEFVRLHDFITGTVLSETYAVR